MASSEPQEDSMTKADRGDVLRATTLGKRFYRLQLKEDGVPAAKVQATIIHYNEQVAGMKYNDIYLHNTRLLRGKYLKKFQRLMKLYVAGLSPSATTSDSEDAPSVPASSSGHRR